MFFRRKPKNEIQQPEPGSVTAWGAEVHPAKLGPHYAVMGQSGGGKTLTIRMLLKSAVAPKGELLHRALIYDPKLDFYPVLRGLGIPAERIHILNPFDKRCSAWDVASDITTHADSEQLAAALLPERGDKNNPYFIDAPRELLAELIDTLRRTGLRWTLNDLVQLVALGHASEVLERSTPAARAAIREHLTENKGPAPANLRSTLRVGIRQYETVAALWARATAAPISVNRWMDDRTPPSVLILGTYPQASETLHNLNRVIFRRCAELLLMKPEYPPDHTWVVLDELSIASELENFPKTLVLSRSKHGHFVLGFQDISGLYHTYGREQTEALVGQCHNFAILRLSSPETMEWASRFFGSSERWVPGFGNTTGQNSSQSHNISLQERRNILNEYFRNLRLPTKAFGIEGIFSIPVGRLWHGHLTPDLVKRYLAQESKDPGLEERDEAEQDPAPFTPGLGQALGVKLVDNDPPSPGGFEPSLPSES